MRLWAGRLMETTAACQALPGAATNKPPPAQPLIPRCRSSRVRLRSLGRYAVQSEPAAIEFTNRSSQPVRCVVR